MPKSEPTTQSPDTDHLFQSDAQLEKSSTRQAKAERTARAGSPIQISSKPLDLVIHGDQHGETFAWTAESGFVARKLNLKVSVDAKLLRKEKKAQII